MDEREDDAPSLPASWPARIGVYAWVLIIHGIFVVLAVIGLLLVHAVVRDWRAGDTDTAAIVIMGLFGVALTAIGIGFFYVAYVGAPRFLGRLERLRRQNKDRPWLLNRQWRARRVVHSIKYTAWFMWFWCLVWWGILGFLWSVNKDLIVADLQGPWDVALPTSIPFVAGGIGLLVATGLTWKRWRYGDAVLLIDTLPGYLGEKFRGRVQGGLANRLRNPVEVILTCGSLRKERRPSRDGHYSTVWITDELWFARQNLQPMQTTFDRGRVTLPIDFDIPSDLPESGHVLDEPQIVWKLEVVPHPGPDHPLQSEFQVPVFSRRERP